MASPEHLGLAYTLPKTPAQWEQKARREEILAPPPKPSDVLSGRQPVYAPSLHVGDHPFDVKLKDLSGWRSASKVQFSHFLTTRTIIQMIEDPAEINKIGREPYLGEFHMTKGNCKESRVWLDKYSDWNRYLDDIATYGHNAPQPGQARMLGEFVNARYHQLQARLRPEKIQAPPNLDPHHLRARDPNVSYHEESPTRDAQMQDIRSVSNSPPLPDLTREYSGGSRFSTALAAEDEEIVNIGLVDFLVALMKSCPHVLLDWDGARANLSVDVGEAHIGARSDGRLHPRGSTDVYILLEVKPFRLNANPDQTLMQMAIQILCWMIQDDFSEDHP
ncbi:hypothetical protein DTO207G8_5295 [Paecilomyces variotii]|nr:hypothetical protein DTO169C6_7675 [Paecilomyces variotii]KAJ9251615.1 hypothetical protein DTO207G8_5295 [Paecilomyces variotii]KAJ9383872.1 hypothetical protein DTO063F5_4976 [Paecilomyces variotii]